MSNLHLDTSSIKEKHLNEWIEGSGVNESIASLNIRSIEGELEIAKFLNWKSYKNDPGWITNGVNPQTGEKVRFGQFKPDRPLPGYTTKEGKAVPSRKYVTPTGAELEPIFAAMPDSRDYWQKIIYDVSQPVMVLEGIKKAACALTYSYPAIALPGVWAGTKKNGKTIKTDSTGGFGYRNPYGEIKNDKQSFALHPWLKLFAQRERKICLPFDADWRANENVRNALKIQGDAFVSAGCKPENVLLPCWDEKYKGLDDLVVSCGPEALRKAIEDAKPYLDVIGRLFPTQMTLDSAPKQTATQLKSEVKPSQDDSMLKLLLENTERIQSGKPISVDDIVAKLVALNRYPATQFVSELSTKEREFRQQQDLVAILDERPPNAVSDDIDIDLMFKDASPELLEFKKQIKVSADARRVPYVYALLTFLNAFGSAMGVTMELHIDNGLYIAKPVLYVYAVGAVGCGKTTTVKGNGARQLAVLDGLAERWHRTASAAIDQENAERQKHNNKVSESGEGVFLEYLPKPKSQHFYAIEATPEGMSRWNGYTIQGRDCFLHIDESSSFVSNPAMYGGADFKSVLLRNWDSESTGKGLRAKIEDTYKMSDPCYNLQTSGRIHSFNDFLKYDGNNGLASRFLVVPVYKRLINSPRIDNSDWFLGVLVRYLFNAKVLCQSEFAEAKYPLLDLSWNHGEQDNSLYKGLRFTHDEKVQTRKVRFSHAAELLYKELGTRFDSFAAKADEFNPVVADGFSRLNQQVSRLALILHAIEETCTGTTSDEISISTLQKACSIAEFCMSSLESLVYSHTEVSSDAIFKVIEAIQRKAYSAPERTVSTRDIQRGMKSYKSLMDDYNARLGSRQKTASEFIEILFDAMAKKQWGHVTKISKPGQSAKYTAVLPPAELVAPSQSQTQEEEEQSLRVGSPCEIRLTSNDGWENGHTVKDFMETDGETIVIVVDRFGNESYTPCQEEFIRPCASPHSDN